MNDCYLSLGSNLKSPQRQIRLGLKKLKALPKSILLDIASLRQTKAWGLKAQPDYCNSAVLLKTTLSPLLLLTLLQRIEKQQGRIRKIRFGSRTLDIDMLHYNNRVFHHPRLTLPHPRIHDRVFVQQPLAELLPRP